MKKIIIVLSFLIFMTLVVKFSMFNSYKSTLEGNIKSVQKNIQKNKGIITYITTFDDLDNKLNDEGTHFLVIGKSGCEYCDKYSTVLDEIIKNYEVEILYVDITKLSKDDYDRLRNSNITIPSSCNDYGIDINLNKKFGTPMTLFINNNQTIDCIRGYNDYSLVSSVLDSIYK